jgi:transcriptional regulator with XRE-family HTH domain
MFNRMASRGVKGFGARMLARRTQLGLSQADVATRMGGKASLEQVSHYEHERRSPGAQAIVDLARALECSTDYLLGVTAQDPPALQALDTRTPKPVKESMPTLEGHLATARRRGLRYTIYGGQPWRLRQDGWEPV